MPLFIVDGGEDGDDQDVDGRKEGGQYGDGPKLMTPTPTFRTPEVNFCRRKSVLRPIFDAYPKAYFRGVVGSEALYDCALF